MSLSYIKRKKDHFHEVKFHTDFSDKHFHESQSTTLIDSPIDFKYK
ncbi:YmaF family protein [Roseburia sp. 499]|nr:YmaF family protein [Roseburia sp. 499]WVK71618.1 hypothetical protein BIV20_12480 [Roseburia sp. 499]